MKQGSEEWLEKRRSYIGSSDAPKIWCENPQEIIGLWEEKIGHELKKFDTAAMKRGRFLEPEARTWFSKKMGKEFWPDFTVSESHPFMCASFDGLDFHGEEGVEIKCPTSRKILDVAKAGEVDIRHKIQMHHQMVCRNLTCMWYLIYFSPDDAHIFQIERSDIVANDLVKKESDFWGYVKKKTSPVQIKNDKEWVSLENEYIKALEEEKAAKEKKERYMEALKSLSENQSCVGSRILLSRFERKGTIDYKKIPELEGVDLEKYRTPASLCWKTTIKS